MGRSDPINTAFCEEIKEEEVNDSEKARRVNIQGWD